MSQTKRNRTHITRVLHNGPNAVLQRGWHRIRVQVIRLDERATETLLHLGNDCVVQLQSLRLLFLRHAISQVYHDRCNKQENADDPYDTTYFLNQ